jgi:hypothetical protein
MNVLLILVSIIVACAFAFLLYYKELKSGLRKNIRLLLSVFRGLSIFIICLLIIGFIVNRKQSYTEKPVIVILADNSLSMVLNDDSLFYYNELNNHISQLENAIQQKADVFLYEFDQDLNNNISYNFNGVQTNIFNAIENIITRYEGRNIAGLILISDGIINSGNDPAMLIERLHFPVHVVACGDTSFYADASIKSLRFNKSAGLGNRFPVEIVVDAKGLNGRNTKLFVTENGKKIHEEQLNFSSDQYSETKTFVFEANTKGIIRLEFQIQALEQEENVANNFASAVIQVIDKKNKTGILYFAPHPDIGAIKTALEEAGNHQVDLLKIEQFKATDIIQYDAFVIYQLPDRRVRSNAIEQIVSSGVPYLLVVGQNTDLRAMASLNTGLRLQQTSPIIQDAFPLINNAFSLFQTSPELQRTIRNFPPLTTHFGNYSLSENYQVFMYQRIGNVQTSNPMLAFSTSGNKTQAILVGEGLHKWKMYDFLNNGNHLTFNEIVHKSINFLVQKADKRRLRVHHKDVYFSTENAELTAEVYNMSMEMVTSPDVHLSVRNNEGKERNVLFTRQINDYRIQLGKMNPGQYSWNAYTIIDNERLDASGIFFIEDMQIEKLQTNTDHSILKFLAQQSNGLFFYMNDIDKVADSILQSTEFHNIEYVNETTDDLISFRWLLFLLVILMSSEWAARKYFGAY